MQTLVIASSSASSSVNATLVITSSAIATPRHYVVIHECDARHYVIRECKPSSLRRHLRM
eukprot:5108883-Pyramimonas_sp.AAC.1